MSVTAHPSLKWDLILDGAVREYPCGRQVCCDTVKGKREYQRRIEAMALRQHGICGLSGAFRQQDVLTKSGIQSVITRGPHLLKNPTFEHSAGRGMNAGHRDDRITDRNGENMNCAACWDCNSEKGSRRL